MSKSFFEEVMFDLEFECALRVGKVKREWIGIGRELQVCAAVCVEAQECWRTGFMLRSWFLKDSPCCPDGIIHSKIYVVCNPF